MEDNFFELGGDLIKVVGVVKRMGENGIKIEIKDLMDRPVVGDLVDICNF